ncbi:FHA domain-containing protein [Clostridium sp. D2Q-14]|uniref:FHA domain-containing protein n=1 Tax=Anaeromonas gelatinilytica TaxID=2683194 RepID=UPI00193C41EF|nr:FHA domain-containing protein [Anaeromonas gelatinilytica]MBS4534616.1 FHA domain-containing protein [Anaeromonas gelatinilytica]
MEGLIGGINIILILLVYIFTFIIFRYIYIDIKSINNSRYDKYPYLKLLNKKDDFSFKIDEVYNIYKNMNIGRNIGNNIIINSPYIEKYHCKIDIRDNKYFIINFNENKSILVNDKEINDELEIKDKDIIELGNLKFMFIRES